MPDFNTNRMMGECKCGREGGRTRKGQGDFRPSVRLDLHTFACRVANSVSETWTTEGKRGEEEEAGG